MGKIPAIKRMLLLALQRKTVNRPDLQLEQNMVLIPPG